MAQDNNTKMSLQLVERLADNSIHSTPLVDITFVPAKSGAQYAVIDTSTGKSPEGLHVKRRGSSLIVETEDDLVLVEIVDFYEEVDAVFIPQAELEGTALAGEFVTSNPATIDTAANGDELIWQGSSGSESHTPLYLGLGALGIGGFAIAAGGSSSNSGGSSGGGTSGGGSPGGPDPVLNTVEGVIVGGPVIEGNDLRVEVYQADGVTRLGEAQVNADGSFSIAVGSYLGVVIARVVNGGPGADYLDEATQVGKDLNAELFAMEVVTEPNSTVNVNLNVLSTLAYHKVQDEASSGTPTSSMVESINKGIADLFGLPSLHGFEVVPTNGGRFNSDDGLSAGEMYGAVLAALSGADAQNGGDSQQTINDLLAGLTMNNGTAVLSESAQGIVVQGAEFTSVQTGDSLMGTVPGIVDTFAPRFTSGVTAGAINENSAPGQVVYTAVASDAGRVTYRLKPVDDHAAFTIDATTGAVTLTGNPDYETKPSYSFTVVATDAAGNSREQSVTLGINNLDEVAPTFTSGSTATAIDENSGAGQAVYTATSTDVADVSTGRTSYSLKSGGDASLFSINAATGVVTLTGNPDYETKPSYSFTVVATDAAGNSREQSVTLGINNLDDTAPKITSGATAAAIDENSGAGQVVYVATSTDDTDVVSGSTVYSLKAGLDAELFSINSTTGVVTLLGNPDYETKSNYSFTLVATDAVGNSSEKVVSLVINNLDDTAPTITSSTTATAINENSGAGQVVYIVTSTDNADISTGSTSYSLKAGGDAELFSINAATGEVVLIGNPDFEVKASYSFTVIATDAANNASEQTVTLAINDQLDEEAPVVSSVAITGASGAQNDTLNTGDVVSVTVTMNESTLIDTTNGIPRVALTIGSSTVYADYVSGSGSAALVFQYTILAGQTDLDGIAIPANALEANGSTLRDEAGNAANLAHSAVAGNASYLVDTTAPSFTSGTSATALDENSGAGQIVYTAAATDTYAVTYSLKAGEDAALFTINAGTGAVTLIGNPDFETKASYAFTVVATDAAGNASEQPVSLTINDLDEVSPIVSGVAITSASGAQGSLLNAGDMVNITVTMDEVVIVTGTPRVALAIGGSTVYAEYVSGSGSSTLVFQYMIQANQTDTNGIAIPANALELHGGTLQDAAGNNAVITHGAIADNASYQVDTTPPSIISSPIATALDENSGTGQTVYTAEATDTNSVTYSLKPVDDYAAFSIDSASGAVTLNGNPDFETKSSYAFTVVATDAAGNASEQTVSLNINDVDDTGPSVSSVAITSASGAQNNTLNAGDVVSVTVGMNEATVVNTAGGTPRVALNIGGSTVYADYVSGSGTSSLVFQYTILAGQTDTNGISIAANALQLNGGTLKDTTGNDAVLTHALVADNASYLVDTTAPTLASSMPSDNASAVAVGANIVLTFNENVLAGSGNIVISNGVGDTRNISVTDTTQVSISGSTVTINPAADLNAGSSYNVQMGSGVLTDQAGNAYAGISDATTLNFETSAAPEVDTSIVVFDLVQGVSSDHSDRTFDAGTTYTIYIRVDSNESVLSTAGDGPGTWGMWLGANKLGGDDKIVLVGSGAPIKGRDGGNVSNISASSSYILWLSSRQWGVSLGNDGELFRGGYQGANVDLWSGGWGVNPNAGLAFNDVYLTNMPVPVLTSQGLT